MVSFAQLPAEVLREYQLKLVEMLDYFDSVCRENDIPYYMTCGSCLGAVRHQGFIPWDDDLDVAIPRDSYEKLWKIWNVKYAKDRYFLLRTTEEQCIRFQIMQLRDASTTCVYSHSTDLDLCHGIKIDICPIDGCPDSLIKSRIQGVFGQMFGLFAAQRIPNQSSKTKQVLAGVILKLIPSMKVRTWLWKWAEHEVSRYSIEQCSRVRCLEGRPVDKRIFGTPVYLPFESGEKPVPEEYRKYLENEYGDYMQLPPKESRKPETVVEYLDLNRGYREYKGVYYLK